ncbi:hypothetical protein Ancab_035869 [Ancistrocladus abbreviatus]
MQMDLSPQHLTVLSCLDVVAFIGGALFLLQQFAGINGVLYFSSLTFQDVGITSAALASLYVGLTNFAVGAGPVTGLIIPELSSNRMRGKIMGFSFSVHWVCNFLVGLFFLEFVETFGVAPVYASFGGVSLLSAIFAYYFIVETKGRSLEQIEVSLRSEFSASDD